MKLTNKYSRVQCDTITIAPDRQRRVVEVSDLLPSIRMFGVMQPIIVTRDLILVAGERRLRASIELGLPDIPARYADELSQIERELIELEENIRRQDLTWQDQVRAFDRIHKIYCSIDPTWNQTRTADATGTSPASIAKYLRIAQDLHTDRIAKAPTMATAYNLLSRVDERRIGDAMSDIAELGAAAFAKAQPSSNPATPDEPIPAPIPSPTESILEQNFLLWAPEYSGPKFNLIHCDFPYGIDYNAGPMSGSEKWETYSDGEDVYWNLIHTLCTHLDKFCTASAHMMFWLSADIDIMQRTRQYILEHSDWNIASKPLIWHKSDNVGILSDPSRRTRHVYEACLLASRDDRLIIRTKSDVYPAPTDKRHHPSTKPEPMLRHFMEMLVDEHTKLLDPTCGSGSSLRAAESLGASAVLGLESSPEHCANARIALRDFRALRRGGKQ